MRGERERERQKGIKSGSIQTEKGQVMGRLFKLNTGAWTEDPGEPLKDFSSE